MGKRLTGICELCGRDGLDLTVHHLIPKELGGTFLRAANICTACHKQIHALYTNAELAIRLNTIASLQDDEKISAFLKWIRKQPATRQVRIRKSNERKQKGR